jgi:hypothetical protein
MGSPGTGPFAGLTTDNRAANFVRASSSLIAITPASAILNIADFGNNFTLVACVKGEGINQASTADYAIFSTFDEGVFNGVEVCLRFDGANKLRTYVSQTFGSKSRIADYDADTAGWGIASGSGTMPSFKTCAVSWDDNAQQILMWMENSSGSMVSVTPTTDNDGSLDATWNFGTQQPCIGSRDALGSSFNGLIGFVALYSDLLTTDQIGLIRNSIMRQNFAWTRRAVLGA